MSYDPATNRQTGECADANGNLCGSGYVYDVENRIVRNSGYLAWAYSYAPGNKRVWRGAWTMDNNFNYTQTLDEITYWSATGQKLATYQLSAYGTQLVATATGTNQYFGGKLIKNASWLRDAGPSGLDWQILPLRPGAAFGDDGRQGKVRYLFPG